MQGEVAMKFLLLLFIISFPLFAAKEDYKVVARTTDECKEDITIYSKGDKVLLKDAGKSYELYPEEEFKFQMKPKSTMVFGSDNKKGLQTEAPRYVFIHPGKNQGTPEIRIHSDGERMSCNLEY